MQDTMGPCEIDGTLSFTAPIPRLINSHNVAVVPISQLQLKSILRLPFFFSLSYYHSIKLLLIDFRIQILSFLSTDIIFCYIKKDVYELHSNVYIWHGYTHIHARKYTFIREDNENVFWYGIFFSYSSVTNLSSMGLHLECYSNFCKLPAVPNHSLEQSFCCLVSAGCFSLKITVRDLIDLYSFIL